MLACRRPSSGWPEYKPKDSKDRLEAVRGIQSDVDRNCVARIHNGTQFLELLDHEDVDHTFAEFLLMMVSLF